MFKFILNWFRKRRSPWASIALPEKKASMNFVMPQHVHIHWHVSDMNKIPQNVIWNAGQLVVSDSTPIEIKSHQYDEYLLDRARTQWQFGDWESLMKIERDALENHPDRAKLALLVAAGHLQQGDNNTARQFTRLAQEWGCSKKLISQILIAGVHNSLGRAAAVNGQDQLALQHFEFAIAAGAPAGEIRLYTKARLGEQLEQLGFPDGMKIRHDKL
jgi:hypothetical protein